MQSCKLCECGRRVQNLTRRPLAIRCSCGAVVELAAAESAGAAESPRLSEPVRESDVAGRESWARLHSYPAENWHAWQPAAAEAWFWESWMPTVPLGCDCRRHWLPLLEQYPPPFFSAAAFAAWAVARHNDVSARLGKPTWTYAQAADLYGYCR
jgi:hypothetical protein